MTHARRRLGIDGEARAAAWYEARRYRVVARNWRDREGELDLVLERDGVLVFCEVKARSSDRFGAAVEAVGPRKQARVRAAAVRFLAAGITGAPRRIRFDVAAVTGGNVEVVEGAF